MIDNPYSINEPDLREEWFAMQETIVFDFDGVLHECASKWVSAEVILDEPVEGMVTACRELMGQGYRLVVLTTRAKTDAGKAAVTEWLEKYKFPIMEVTHGKPLACVYVDDKAIRFMGSAKMMMEKIKLFQQPWNKGDWLMRRMRQSALQPSVPCAPCALVNLTLG